jgi:Domain of unknown function (DUF4295)
MAKKVVATLRDKSKVAAMVKVIRAVKNADTGSYSFKEEMVPTEQVQDFLKTGKN